MTTFRRFRNTDPPALADVWNESHTARGAYPLRTPSLLERWVLSKSYFDPDGLSELRYIREMADVEWRLRRVRSYLESALSRHMATLSGQHLGLHSSDLQSLAVETLSQTGCSYATWLRYETKFERQYDRACKAWTLYQVDRRRCARQDVDLALRQALTGPPPVAEEASSGKLGSNVQTAAEPSSPAPHTAGPHIARPHREPSPDAAAA